MTPGVLCCPISFVRWIESCALDIATAKATPEELATAPHHMINIIDPKIESYTVREYKSAAGNVIDNLRRQNKMPIIVGGTNYYIEALLWDFTLNSSVYDEAAGYAAMETESLYQKLESIDPKTAEKLHPNNRRKILTALNFITANKTPLSQEIAKQHESLLNDKMRRDENEIRGRLRYPDCLGIFIDCEAETLERRIRQRVDKMISDGLLEELESFGRQYYEDRVDKSFDKGIFQVLGFKEFDNYFKLSSEEKDSQNGQKIFKESTELLKQRSVRYAKYQLKWIRKRLLQQDNSFPIFKVDSTDVELWDSNVLKPAVQVLVNFLNGNSNETFAPMVLEKSDHNPHKRFVCDVCGGKVIIGEIPYQDHIKGKGHLANLRKIRQAKLEK